MINTINISSSSDINKAVRNWKKKKGIEILIGFWGGTDTKLEGVDNDEIQDVYSSVLNTIQATIIKNTVQILSDYRVGIISGGTSWGVPRVAIEEAKRYQMATIGIYPSCGHKYVLTDGLLDLKIQVNSSYQDSRWGDESVFMTKMIDAAIIIGGGAGTLVECAHVLKANEAIIKQKGRPKILIPIAKTGGVADGIHFLYGKQHVKAITLPKKAVYSGQDAAKIIINRLSLDDYHCRN